jgi:hypothetical protein
MASFKMDIFKMLEDLRNEKQQIDEAIAAIQRFALGQGKRQGRPPAWMKSQPVAPKRRGRPPGIKNRPKTQRDSS